MTTATELARLLRGCLRWENGRPRVDNDALLVVADWCEDQGMTAEAGVIRAGLGQRGRPPEIEDSYRFGDGIGLVMLHQPHRRRRYAAAYTFWHFPDRRDGTCEVLPLAEDEFQIRRGRPSATPGAEGLMRVRNLGHWCLVCRMLGSGDSVGEMLSPPGPRLFSGDE